MFKKILEIKIINFCYIIIVTLITRDQTDTKGDGVILASEPL